jgi:GT2 family glycosyltransferase
MNTLHYLKQAIASVEVGFNRCKTEIIVVDNGSTDGSKEYVASLPYVGLIANQENRGFASANNQAFEIAQGRHMFLLNSDAFLQESCGDLLLDFLLAHPRVGLVVPTFEYPSGRWQPSFGPFPTVLKATRSALGIDDLIFAYYTVMDHWLRGVLKPRRVDYGEGAGLLIRDEVLHTIGGMSPEYLYSEDIDYCLRALKADWQTWWVPAARLTHVRGGTLSRKDLEAGLQVKLDSATRFLTRNYSPKEACIIYKLWLFRIQRMFLTVRFLSLIPGLQRLVGDRPQRYQVVRKLYRSYSQRVFPSSFE